MKKPRKHYPCIFTFEGKKVSMMSRSPRLLEHILRATFILLCLLSPSVQAGPPFATDDPFPLPLHTGEGYLFAAGAHDADGTTFDAAPGIEMNFSFFRNTFFHLVAPLALNNPERGPSYYGIGDLELGFKWRFSPQSDKRPDIGIFPLIEIPTGNENHGLGSEKPQVFLPVWLGKDVDNVRVHISVFTKKNFGSSASNLKS